MRAAALVIVLALNADSVPASSYFSRLSAYRLEFSIAVQGGENGVRRLAGPGDRIVWPKLQGIRAGCLRQAKVSMVYDLSETYAGGLADRDLDRVMIDRFSNEDVAEGGQRLLTCAALALDDPATGIIINRRAFAWPRVLVRGPGRKAVTPNVAKWRSWLGTVAGLRGK